MDNAAADDRDIDYVFAAWVDKDFAADDLLAEDAENFENMQLILRLPWRYAAQGS